MLHIHFNVHFLLCCCCFFFLLMTYYLLFILDYGNDVRQKVNSINFLFKFKMGHKAVETTHNLKNALAQELLMNIQCSGSSAAQFKLTLLTAQQAHESKR